MTHLGWLRTNMLLVSCKFEACGIFFSEKKNIAVKLLICASVYENRS